MGKKIGFGFLAFFMCAMTVTFLFIQKKELAIMGILMALIWGTAAVFFACAAIGSINPALFHWGWLIAAFLCGQLAAAGIASGFGKESGAKEIVIGAVFILLTYLCLKKARGGSAKLLTGKRSFHPGDPLPVSSCPGLFMMPGEVGHLCESVRIGKVKNIVTGRRSSHSGSSVRVAKGLSVHGGGSRSTTIRQDVLDAGNGTLYVTNKRVVGSSPKYSFDAKFSSITAIQPYIDGFSIQISGKSYTILSNSPSYIIAIISAAQQGQ